MWISGHDTAGIRNRKDRFDLHRLHGKGELVFPEVDQFFQVGNRAGTAKVLEPGVPAGSVIPRSPSSTQVWSTATSSVRAVPHSSQAGGCTRTTGPRDTYA